jgi:hypothetical protein
LPVSILRDIHGFERQNTSNERPMSSIYTMSLPREHALTEAKGLCRTLPSAPSPRARASAIFALLTRVETWTPEQKAKIVGFGEWLATRPHDGALRERCKQLLTSLA